MAADGTTSGGVTLGGVTLGEDESVAAGTDRPPRRWVVLAVPLLAAVCLGAWADARWESASAANLAAVREQARAEQERGVAEVAGMVAYSGPTLAAADLPEGVRADLVGLIAGAAERSASRIEALTPPAPVNARWHGALAGDWEATVSEVSGRAADVRAIAAQYGA